MKLIGVENVLRRLTFDEGAILKVLDDLGNDIAQDAINRVNDDFVGATINVQNLEGGWIINVGSDFELAAFLEWGTGDHVVIPPETTSAYAMQWFKNGKGTLRAAPFLIPAWRIVAGKLAGELTRELNKQFG